MSGNVVRSNSSRLALSSCIIAVKPVIFPPGCERLGTRPDSTGSTPVAPITIGMFLVASLAHVMAGPPSAARGPRGPPSSRRPAGTPARGGSFDDLVGTGEDRWWDGEAEGLGDIEIDDQLECGRLLHR